MYIHIDWMLVYINCSYSSHITTIILCCSVGRMKVGGVMGFAVSGHVLITILRVSAFFYLDAS